MSLSPTTKIMVYAFGWTIAATFLIAACFENVHMSFELIFTMVFGVLATVVRSNERLNGDFPGIIARCKTKYFFAHYQILLFFGRKLSKQTIPNRLFYIAVNKNRTEHKPNT